MLKLTIEVTGKCIDDLVMALERITGQVDNCYREGFDRKHSGRYHFKITGEPFYDSKEDGEEDNHYPFTITD